MADVPEIRVSEDGRVLVTFRFVWEKANGVQAFSPEILEDMGQDLPERMMGDFLDAKADDRFGPGRWVKRDDVQLEEFEPWTRDHEYAETDDDDNPVLDEHGNPVMVAYHDDSRHFRMTARYRAKGPGE